jgi:hypothetical protein
VKPSWGQAWRPIAAGRNSGLKQIMSWGGAKGLDDIRNIPLLATEIPGFPQDVHDGHAVHLHEELEQMTVLGELQDDTVVVERHN